MVGTLSSGTLFSQCLQPLVLHRRHERAKVYKGCQRMDVIFRGRVFQSLTVSKWRSVYNREKSVHLHLGT